MKKLIASHKRLLIAAGVISVLSVLVAIVSMAGLYFSDKIIHAQISETKILVKNEDQARDIISKSFQLPQSIEISIKTPTDEQVFTLDPQEFDASLDASQTAARAKVQSRLLDIFNPRDITPVIDYDQQLLDEKVSLIAAQVYIPPVYPDIIVESGVPTVQKGNIGYQLDIDQFKKKVLQALKNKANASLALELTSVGQILGAEDENLIMKNYQLLEDKTIDIIYEDYSKVLGPEELIKLISNVSGFEETPVEMLIKELAANIETEPKNPVFREDNNRVVEFIPSTNGVRINGSQFRKELQNSLDELLSTDLDSISLEVPVTEIEAEIKTSDVNDYGIKELIGRGSSMFVGSIPNRVHNVALAAEKINGTLVAPGETFSFNKTIGDISVYTGFKQSYVIQGNQTVLGDGGGVCQVSTTLFRAALNSGLPIAERRAHSYRVGYYEQGSPVGLDATIYSPSVDLKITNDTPAHMLIQAYVDTKKMTLEFEIYGTDDGREVTLTEPVITSRSPAPEDLYIDDPTKPTGYIEQIDYAAAGARVEYDYKVVRDGEVLIDKTFYSNYRPWQAKFIRGTGPAN